MRAIPLLRVAIPLLLAFGACVASAATPFAGSPRVGMVNGVPQLDFVTAARASPGPGAAAYLKATPITYSFSGTASGTLSEVPFTDASIVVDAVGDATAVSFNGEI